MNYYINCLAQSSDLKREIKDLVPDMNMRRRMSRVVKMGVTTALESLAEFQQCGPLDAVITATGLGCVADSEKFLSNVIDSTEQMVNPTPFIQSTFNTVGAQIAIARSLNCYNNTFSHSHLSFESALLDAMLCLSSARATAVLVGVFDESTPTVEVILRRVGVLREKRLGEGAIFFVLTAERSTRSVAQIELSFDTPPTSTAGAIMVCEATDTLWCGATAQLMATMISRRQNCVLLNDMGGAIQSAIKITNLCS